jgi:NADP-dependent 3-hydroxy acid dehydrogenase YdfG
MTTWFITGSSRGFGRAVALEALRRGEQVIATARDAAAIKDLAAQFGDRVLPLALDVTDSGQVTAAVLAAENRFGAIDVLFNNAGIGYFAAFEESDDAEARRLMETNVFGLAAVTKAVLPGMRARRRGTVLNMSSIGGLRSFPALA